MPSSELSSALTLKDVVYQMPIASPEDFVSRICTTDSGVCDMPEILQRVRDSFHRQCEACIAGADRSFERLL